MDVNLSVPALEKLLDYAASGVGSIAGSLLAPWKARQQSRAGEIAATGQARALGIEARAQAEAREILASRSGAVVTMTINDRVSQRIQFQEEKRQRNIEAVVKDAADRLGDQDVPHERPDHDWTARFFSYVQDVSREELRILWARILAGEVKRKGNTSIRTLQVLRNLDCATADLFGRLASVAIALTASNRMLDMRVPSLGGQAQHNSLKDYGFSFDALNLLNEHGLIIADYNSWFDYRMAIGIALGGSRDVIRVPFSFGGEQWILQPEPTRKAGEYRVHGVALTRSGVELARIAARSPADDFARALATHFEKNRLKMVRVGA